MTHHNNLIADHTHIEHPQLTTPEIILDHVPIHPTNPQGMFQIGDSHSPADHEVNHKYPHVFFSFQEKLRRKGIHSDRNAYPRETCPQPDMEIWQFFLNEWEMVN